MCGKGDWLVSIGNVDLGLKVVLLQPLETDFG
jgi:hypothetical protein